MPRAVILAFGPVVLLLLAGWFLIAEEIAHERVRAEESARRDAMNLATAFEAHVRSVVQHLDMTLLDVREDLVADPSKFVQKATQARRIYGDLVAQLALIDARGYLAFSNLAPASKPIDLTDRDHFKVHSQHPEADRLYISRPVLGRVSKRWTIQFTRPVHRGGRFAGVLVLSVPTEYFSGYYGRVDVGPGGAIALVGEDRALRARAPENVPREELMQAVIPQDRPFFRTGESASGFYQAVSVIDGLERLAAYRRLEDLGLIVLVLLSPNDFLAEQRDRKRLLLAGGAAVSAFFLTAALVVYRLMAQHLKDLKALREKNRELDRMATTDALTGCASRSAFFEAAEAAVQHSLRYGTALSVLILDIDHFKTINDTYGHPTGDEVLREVAVRCMQALRVTDRLGRVGGEEFAVLLPETGPHDAAVVAEKLRHEVAATPVVTHKGKIPVTTSIGLASWYGRDDDLAMLWQRADDGLYQAKRSGRNRVGTIQQVEADAPQVLTA